MNKKDLKINEYVRALDSGEAADWVMDNYPVGSDLSGKGILIICCRTWKKKDQSRLANYYMSNKPYAHSRFYESFLKVMSIRNFINILEKKLPLNDKDLRMLAYCVIPVLKKYCRKGGESEKKLVESFIEKIKSNLGGQF